MSTPDDGWRNVRGDRRGINRVLHGAGSAFLAAAALVALKPGRPGRMRCEAVKRGTSERCGHLALAGQRTCYVHGCAVWGRKRGAARRAQHASEHGAAPAPAAPRELQAHPAYRRAGQRGRNALAQAWATGDAAAWRAALAAVERGEHGEG